MCPAIFTSPPALPPNMAASRENLVYQVRGAAARVATGRESGSQRGLERERRPLGRRERERERGENRGPARRRGGRWVG